MDPERRNTRDITRREFIRGFSLLAGTALGVLDPETFTAVKRIAVRGTSVPQSIEVEAKPPQPEVMRVEQILRIQGNYQMTDAAPFGNGNLLIGVHGRPPDAAPDSMEAERQIILASPEGEQLGQVALGPGSSNLQIAFSPESGPLAAWEPGNNRIKVARLNMETGGLGQTLVEEAGVSPDVVARGATVFVSYKSPQDEARLVVIDVSSERPRPRYHTLGRGNPGAVAIDAAGNVLALRVDHLDSKLYGHIILPNGQTETIHIFDQALGTGILPLSQAFGGGFLVAKSHVENGPVAIARVAPAEAGNWQVTQQRELPLPDNRVTRTLSSPRLVYFGGRVYLFAGGESPVRSSLSRNAFGVFYMDVSGSSTNGRFVDLTPQLVTAFGEGNNYTGHLPITDQGGSLVLGITTHNLDREDNAAVVGVLIPTPIDNLRPSPFTI